MTVAATSSGHGISVAPPCGTCTHGSSRSPWACHIPPPTYPYKNTRCALCSAGRTAQGVLPQGSAAVQAGAWQRHRSQLPLRNALTPHARPLCTWWLHKSSPPLKPFGAMPAESTFHSAKSVKGGRVASHPADLLASLADGCRQGAHRQTAATAVAAGVVDLRRRRGQPREQAAGRRAHPAGGRTRSRATGAIACE